MLPYLQALLEAGAQVYEVGGAVRDRLLNRTRDDHDYLVRLLEIEQITKILQRFGKVQLVGQSFGVIKFTPKEDRAAIDFVLPRQEYSTGVGHRDFEVSFDPSLPLEEDLGRRDFTINAMAQDIKTGHIIDPFHGKEDLEHKLLRIVFPKAFEEDPLRMLRAIQFAARFDFEIEPATKESIRTNAKLISTISAERVIDEIRKLMKAPKPSRGFYLMKETDLLRYVFPDLAILIDLKQDKQPGDDVFAHTMRVLDAARNDPELLEPGEINLMFAALFHDVGKAKTERYHEASQRTVFFGHQIVSARMARKWMREMKVETIGVDPSLVCKLVEQHMFETKAHFTERAIRRFIAKIGKDIILKLLDLRFADNRGGKYPQGVKGVLRLKKRIQEELAKKPPFGAKDLTVNCHDLMELGIPAGPLLGNIITHLVEMVLDHPEKNQKDLLLAEVKRITHEKHP